MLASSKMKSFRDLFETATNTMIWLGVPDCWASHNEGLIDKRAEMVPWPGWCTVIWATNQLGDNFRSTGWHKFEFLGDNDFFLKVSFFLSLTSANEYILFFNLLYAVTQCPAWYAMLSVTSHQQPSSPSTDPNSAKQNMYR